MSATEKNLELPAGKETRLTLRGAIFDMDGTLLDSMSLWMAVGEEYVLRKGMQPEDGLREVLKPMNLGQVARYIQTQYGLMEDEQVIIDEFHAMVERHYFETLQLKPGVLRVVEYLAGQGVEMCVATLTDDYLAEAAITRTGLRGYFRGIITGAQVNAGKDTPAIFEAAVKLLGTKKEETVVFEDLLVAIQTAKTAGHPVVGVYDEAQAPFTEEIKKSADFYIQSFEELAELLDKSACGLEGLLQDRFTDGRVILNDPG